MSETAERREQRFTYQEYLTWPEEERWERIVGLASNMTPATTRLHQLISRQLLTLFNNYRWRFRLTLDISPRHRIETAQHPCTSMQKD